MKSRRSSAVVAPWSQLAWATCYWPQQRVHYSGQFGRAPKGGFIIFLNGAWRWAWAGTVVSQWWIGGHWRTGCYCWDSEAWTAYQSPSPPPLLLLLFSMIWTQFTFFQPGVECSYFAVIFTNGIYIYKNFEAIFQISLPYLFIKPFSFGTISSLSQWLLHLQPWLLWSLVSDGQVSLWMVAAVIRVWVDEWWYGRDYKRETCNILGY